MAENEETTTARYIASNVSTQLMLKTLRARDAELLSLPAQFTLVIVIS
jgi:hypothetical protein